MVALCAGVELKFLSPEQILNKDMKKNEKYKSQIEKLLPEPKPNCEPLLITYATLAHICSMANVRMGICASHKVYYNLPYRKPTQKTFASFLH
jgi:hypothetical protein